MKRCLIGMLALVLLAGVPTVGAMPLAAPDCFAVPGITDCIDGQFKSYWRANGGLPVFGYPLTSERPENNNDTPALYTTQWFERNRFEAHPENKPPYHVLLGRLGAELLGKQGRGFEGPPAGTTLQGRCRTFDVGGKTQAVCDPFLQYWETHGLEFDGKAGTSYNESLALFGLPLTYPKLETNPNGDTVLTQWFERARFEDHKSAGVLLGLLGRETRAGLPTNLLVPIVDGDTGYLLGATQGGLWRNATTTAAQLRGGETYRLYDSATSFGKSSGSKPTPAGVPCDDSTFVVKLRPEPQARSNTFAFGGEWNPLPRTATAQSTDSTVYRTAIADILKEHGIANPEVRLTAIWRVDLEGDGTDEVLISATRLTSRGPNVAAGDYSLVVLRRVVQNQVQTSILEAEYHPVANEFTAPTTYRIAALLDLNGDGQLEVVLDNAYWEGIATGVYEMQGGQPKLVLSAGCGA